MKSERLAASRLYPKTFHRVSEQLVVERRAFHLAKGKGHPTSFCGGFCGDSLGNAWHNGGYARQRLASEVSMQVQQYNTYR